jgi:hypothetical protein
MKPRPCRILKSLPLIHIDLSNAKTRENWNRLQASVRRAEKISMQYCAKALQDKICYGSCCQGCAVNFGYWRIIPVDWEYPLRAIFHDRYGFYNPGYGCRLPREMRSITCRSYLCGAERNKLSDNIKRQYALYMERIKHMSIEV